MTLEVIAYILSLAFQVSGAVLLIIKYWGRTKERIIDEYFPGSNVIERDNNDLVKLEKKKVQLCAQNIYANRMAFVFIAIGYILSIFGVLDETRKFYILFHVILGTIIIIIIEKIFSGVVSKIFYDEDIVMPYKEIANRADTILTEAEVMEIINGTYKEEKNI